MGKQPENNLSDQDVADLFAWIYDHKRMRNKGEHINGIYAKWLRQEGEKK